ncbi:MAG: chorismate mutase, partial [Patescibacteria group bacterium]
WKLTLQVWEELEEIGKIKHEVKLPVCDPGREEKQFARYEELAKLHVVPPELITIPFRAIVFWSKLFQQGWKGLTDLKRRRFPKPR